MKNKNYQTTFLFKILDKLLSQIHYIINYLKIENNYIIHFGIGSNHTYLLDIKQ